MQGSKFIMLFVFATFVAMPVFAQDKPKVTIYVASDELKDNEKRMLGTKVLAPFIQSGKFTAVERSDAFLNGIERERKKQRDGSVDDSQISRLGKEAGVQFVCIADLIDAFGIYSLSARLINTETAEIVGIGETEMKNLSEIGIASDEVFAQISSGKKSQAKPVATTAKPIPTPAPKTQVNRNIKDLEILKEIKVGEEIKASFSDLETFFKAASTGFSDYFKRYDPRLYSKDDETLTMYAKYGKHDVMCTFFRDMNSKYIVAIDTKFDRDRQKWLKNVVKNVEKHGAKK